MKNLLLFTFVAFLSASCYEDHSELIPGQDFISEEMLVKIKENGQPIYEGLNPPKVEGKYIMSPLILEGSNFDDSFEPGRKFADNIVEFTDFNPKKLTLKVNVEQGSSVGKGYGSFIAGEGNNFTIYVKIDVTENDGDRHLATEVYSGTLESNGIRDLHLSFFMLDDGGDPEDDLIENGYGRLFVDGNEFSEKL